MHSPFARSTGSAAALFAALFGACAAGPAAAGQSGVGVNVTITLPAVSPLYCRNAIRRNPGRDPATLAPCQPFLDQFAATGAPAPSTSVSAVAMPPPAEVTTAGGVVMWQVASP